MIPRLIHWWWDGPQVPLEYVRFRNRWAELHPEWEVMIWDERSFLLNFEHHPGAGLYQQQARWSPRSNEWGWKTNIARLLILQRLGGLWVDADLEPLKTVDPLIEPLDESGGSLAAYEDDRGYINNAFLATPSGSPFIEAAVGGLAERVKARRGKPSNIATGAHYLTELAQRHPELEVLPRELIYPMHWSELHRRAEEFPEAYTLHHWHRKSTEKPTRPARRQQRSGPTAARKSTMNVSRFIRRIEGLTTEPACLALADMAARVPAERAVVELGVYQARTALYLAWGASQGAGAHVWGFDAWDLPGTREPYQGGRMRRRYTDTATRNRATRNIKSLGFADRVTLARQFSAEAGRGWTGPPVGLLFVDADHRYEAVWEDVRAWVPHLAPDAVIAFDDYAGTHPEVIRAVDDMVTEGILEPVEIYHDRLAVTRLGSGHPELVRRELEEMPEVRRAEEARQELADAILAETDISVPRGGVEFPLPDASEGDSTEREHPGTQEPMEGAEGTPGISGQAPDWSELAAESGDGSGKPCPPPDSVYAERVIEEAKITEATPEGASVEVVRESGPAPAGDRSGSATIPPAEGRPVQAAGKAQTVPAAASGHHPVDDANLPLAEWAVPGELGLSQAVRLKDLSLGQLKALAKERGVTLGRDGKTRPVALAKLKEAAESRAA